MTIETATIRDNIVYRDSVLTWRLYDAFGPSVVKHLEDFVYWNTDDTTGDSTAYTQTVVEVGAGDSTAVLSTGNGGNLLITAAANENDGLQLQSKNATAFQLNGLLPCYFGIKFQAGDVDQSDFLVGLAVQDTTVIAAVADGLYFRSVDAAATVQFILEKNSLEASTDVATMTDATDITLEYYFDGVNTTAYVDGTQQAQVAFTSTNHPDDVSLTPTIAFLTGEAVANTMTVSWMRAIQLR
jgi:hypothetical protein